jgi:thymidylate synthase
MKQYIELITRIIKEGHESGDRTGVGTTKIFGHQSTYNMDDGFPLLTLKKTWMPGVTHELLWLLGCHMKDERYKDLPMTNIKYLKDNKVGIWDEWADEDGNLGPVYGKQWVDWNHKLGTSRTTGASVMSDDNLLNESEGINQIQIVIDKLTEGHEKFNPMDRGLIVSAWNVGDLDEMALRPCHAFFQFQARELSHDERVKEEWNIRDRANPGKFTSPGIWTEEP